MAKNPIFLHIGNNVSVAKRDVVAILDPDSSTISKVTRNYIKKKQNDGKVEVVSNDLPGAFVITGKVKTNKEPKSAESKLYISHISASALAGRFF